MHFYRGDIPRAADCLSEIPSDDSGTVLLLMERGMIRQALQDYAGSAEDWLRCIDTARRLDYFSLSREAASLVTNDRALGFRGTPYERTLLRAFNAQNYLALALWDDAAVEARNIIARLENLGEFPDDAFSRYMAGFCLEMQDDSEGAALQYRLANELLDGIAIDPGTGRIGPADAAGPPAAPSPGAELVCFIAIDRYSSLPGTPPVGACPSGTYAELYAGETRLGRSYPFADLGYLYGKTQERLAALKLLKQSSRIALKELAAQALEQQNELLGELLRLALFSTEVPDNRRWETLPTWLHVARVPCPPNLAGYTVEFKSREGQAMRRKDIAAPLTHRRNVFVSFCRNL